MILQGPDFHKHVLVMVGLPARGKTFVARKIARYLSWLGYNTRSFNVGEYRRAIAGAKQPASFFAPDAEHRELRERIAMKTLDDLLGFLNDRGDVAIYDATNTERERRQRVYERCRAAGTQVIFVECLCEDDSVVEANIRENKLNSPDYHDMDPDAAVADFRERIAQYERTYVPVDDEDRCYVKLIDVGRKVVVNRMQGYLGARLVFFLMNLHPGRRKLWLTRHGESEFNATGRIGGDPDLSERGRIYAQSLAEFFAARGEKPVEVWTSSLKRAMQTAEALPLPKLARRALDEIDAGICDGMTYQEIRERMPEEYRARAADKFRYRYPQGESYTDVIQRLEPVIFDLERQKTPVVVIAHHAITRALYAYLMGRPQEDTPHVPVPLHTVLELTPTAYGYEEKRFELAPYMSGEDTLHPMSVGAPPLP
ncbi:MAG: 6-phosphofructo-2-kinase/fructose-2,6-bisphosphatase [Polyangiaceae bacterium]